MKSLTVLNVYLAYEDYKEGAKYGAAFGVINVAGALVGMPGAGTVLGQAKDLPPVDPVKLAKGMVSGASPKSVAMGWLFGAFR